MPQRHRPELSEVVVGEPFVGYRRSARTFGRGRVCRHEGCTTCLSMYNSGALCALHTSSAAADATLRMVPGGNEKQDVADVLDVDTDRAEPGPSPGPRTRPTRRAPTTDPPAHLAAS